MIETWPVDFSSVSRVRKALSPPSSWKLDHPSASQTKMCAYSVPVWWGMTKIQTKSNQTKPMSLILSKLILPRGRLYFLGENQIRHIGNCWEHPGKERFYSHITRLPEMFKLGRSLSPSAPSGACPTLSCDLNWKWVFKILSIMGLNGFEIPLFLPPIVVN